VHVASISGVNVAFLNYTSSTNGIPMPSEHSYAVNMIDSAAILGEAERARDLGAELVVAVLHWGEEYEREANEGQRALADKLLRGGIDVIIGHHPHVVQPIRRLTVERGGEDFRAYVAYSLGNFVSNQRWRYADSGIILLVDVVKQSGRVRVEGIRYVPIYVQKGFKDGSMSFRVLPLSANGLPESDVPFTSEDKARIPEVREELLMHLDNPDKGITIAP
jgi:poly-gamma-glutamate synthesis protein (capsule biosynthesis protein)